MSEAKSYTIDKVGWHTRTPGNTEPWEKTHRRFRAVINFLQDNGLTTRTILGEYETIDDDTCIHTDHLNDSGRALIKKCYSRWLRKVDRGLDAGDISMLQKEFDRSTKGTDE
jgi:hypothetical protein